MSGIVFIYPGGIQRQVPNGIFEIQVHNFDERLVTLQYKRSPDRDVVELVTGVMDQITPGRCPTCGQQNDAYETDRYTVGDYTFWIEEEDFQVQIGITDMRRTYTNRTVFVEVP